MNINKISPWSRFINLLKLDKNDIKQIIYYSIFAGFVALSLPLGIQAIINLIQSAQLSTSWIILVSLVTLGVAFQGILQYMQIRIIENIQQKIFFRASFEFSYRFPKIKTSQLHNDYPPELANRFFDTITVQKVLPKLIIDFPTAFLQIILGLILLSFYHAFFILYGALLIFLIYVLYKFTAKKGLETSLKESKNKYQVAHWIQQIARSQIGFKISGKTSLGLDLNDKFTSEYLDARESHFKVLKSQFIQLIIFKVLVTVGLLVIGGMLVVNQQMNIGQFVASEIIILTVISSVEKFIKGLDSIYDALTSLEKLGQVVDKELESQEGENPFETHDNLNIELDEISINSDSGIPLLKNISLKIPPKSKIFIDGASGPGKTTLLKLIAGVENPSRGTIYVNNIPINIVSLQNFRSSIGLMLPAQTPFEGTILENITLGRSDISNEKLHDVLKHLSLLDFIKKQPLGLQTCIFPEDLSIPYSVTKKVLLARALIHEPKLLLLNHPIEYFDAECGEKVVDYLTDPKHPWSIVVISKNKLWEKNFERYKMQEGTLIKKQ